MEDTKKVRVVSTHPFKLKKDTEKSMRVDLRNYFGFLPEKIIVERTGKNDFVVHALITNEHLQTLENLKQTIIKKS